MNQPPGFPKEPSVLLADNTITNGERVCPVTQQKCPSLCPTPKVRASGFSEQTGWAGGQIQKCQEGIYFIANHASVDGAIETRYLPVEAYANFPKPPFDSLVRQSTVIGWGNYQKELAREYKEPLDSHVFFKDAILDQPQRCFGGPVMTKVTPMSLEMAKLPPLDLLVDKVFEVAGEDFSEEKSHMKARLDLRAGYFIDLRQLRMNKQVRVNSGASTLKNSPQSPDMTQPTQAYQTPVDYAYQFSVLNGVTALYSIAQLGGYTTVTDPVKQESAGDVMRQKYIELLRRQSTNGELSETAESLIAQVLSREFTDTISLRLPQLERLTLLKQGELSNVPYSEVRITVPEVRCKTGLILMSLLRGSLKYEEAVPEVSKEEMNNVCEYLRATNVSLETSTADIPLLEEAYRNLLVMQNLNSLIPEKAVLLPELEQLAYRVCIKELEAFANGITGFQSLWNQATSYMADAVIKLQLDRKVFDNFYGQRLFQLPEESGDSIEQQREQYTYPDLYICSWDHPFDETNFDFTLYYLNGPALSKSSNNFPLVDLRIPASDKGLPENQEERENALARFGGLENQLGVEMLHSYFLDAGVQAGAIPAPDRTYLGVLGTTYIANLYSFDHGNKRAVKK